MKKDHKSTSSNRDRRRSIRFDTSLLVQIRFFPDGQPVEGQAVEIGPNGMRLMSPTPLIEASYVHISFQRASNNTYCEGRVVWTQKTAKKEEYESGIDIQRWGGSIPTEDIINEAPFIRHKKDRRREPR